MRQGTDASHHTIYAEVLYVQYSEGNNLIIKIKPLTASRRQSSRQARESLRSRHPERGTCAGTERVKDPVEEAASEFMAKCFSNSSSSLHRILRSRFPNAPSSLRMTVFKKRSRRKKYTCTKIHTMPSAWIYILTNKRHTTLYVGVTNDLPTRLWEHRTKRNSQSFTARYNLNSLVYYEPFDSIIEAINREKYIKGKTRKWKEDLINSMNPDWKDLTNEDFSSLTPSHSTPSPTKPSS